MMFSIDRMVDALSSDNELACPHCGHIEQISDPDVCMSVVSYWGDEPHEIGCGSCGKDYIVSERVTRKFRTFRSFEEMRGSDL